MNGSPGKGYISDLSPGPQLPPGFNLRDWRHALRSAIFDNLEERVVRDALRDSQLACFRRGQPLFSSGNRPQDFTLVLQGRIKLFYIDRNGDERGQRFVGPGELLCPLCDPDAAETTCCLAEAAETLQVVLMPADSFLHAVQTHAALAQNLINQLALSLERAGQKAGLCKARSAQVLVASYLLVRLEQKSWCDLRPIGLTAQEIGVARETLSRTLTFFRKKGVIDYQQGHVSALNLASLRELATEL